MADYRVSCNCTTRDKIQMLVGLGARGCLQGIFFFFTVRKNWYWKAAHVLIILDIIASAELLAKGQAAPQLEVALCYACYEVMMQKPFGEILWLSAKHSEWFLLLVPNKLKKKPS